MLGLAMTWAVISSAAPVRFVENVVHGDDVKFHARVRGVDVFFSEGGVSFVFAVHAASESYSRRVPIAFERWDLTFPGARLNPEPFLPSSETVRYYLGEKFKTASVSHGLMYREAFPGTDLRFYGADGGIKFDFVLHPGADPAALRFRLVGKGAVERFPYHVAPKVSVQGAVFSMLRPVGWAGNREFGCEYRSFEDGSTGFCCDETPQGAWVLDPLILLGAGFYGGSDYDEIHALGADSLGNAYAVGTTFSVNFPKLSAWQFFLNNDPGMGGNCDAFLLCWDVKTGQRKWATYFGGSRDDLGRAIAVTPDGQATIFGTSYSENLPLRLAYQGQYGGLGDGFAAAFAPDGRLNRASYMGGNGEDGIQSAALAPDGLRIFVGSTASDNLYAFGGYSSRNLGETDVFVAALDSNLTPRRLFYFGGGDQDYGKAVAVDDAGRIFVAGESVSNFFPRFGDRDVFVAVFDADGLVAVSGVGGRDRDECAALSVSPAGKVYVFGHTFSENFPVMGEVLGGTFGGKADWTLAIFRFDGTTLTLAGSGVWGGDELDFARGACRRPSDGALTLVGQTYEKNLFSDFQPGFGGGDTDGAIIQTDSSGKKRLFSYFGASKDDELFSAVYAADILAVAGKTDSPDLYRDRYFQQTNLSSDSFDGCVAAFDGKLPLSRPQNADFSDLSLYPNPVYGDKIRLAGTSFVAGRRTFVLYDATGRTVSSYSRDVPSGNFEWELALPVGLSEGYYYLEGLRFLWLGR
jgi:hypothetical protein